MKRLNTFIIGSICLLLVACNMKDPIIGEWKLTGMNIDKALNNIPANQKEMARKLMEPIFKSMKWKMKIIFEKDGKFKLENPSQNEKTKVDVGTWSLSKDSKKLTTIIDGKSENYNIIELTEDKLIIGMHLSGQEEVDLTFSH